MELSSAALRLPPAMHTRATSRKKKPELDDKALGKRLRDLRLRQGMTQLELATKVGLKQPMLSLYERGDVRLPAILAARLVQTLGASCDELVGLKESRENGQIQDRALVRRLQKVERLSRRDKQTLLRTIDRFLQGSGAS
jgi:transcriptional regulator with XRE-family HTH domain